MDMEISICGSRGEPEAELGEWQHAAWFELLRAHAALVGRVEKRAAESGALAPGWYDVLLCLEKAGGRMRLHELASSVLLSRSGLSRLVDRIEEAGFLRRESCDCDKRGAFAVLTDAGREAREAAWPEHARAIGELFARHVSDEEAAVVARVLRRVANAACE